MSSASVILSIYFLAGIAAIAIYLALSSGQRQLKDKIEDLALEARIARGVFELRPGESEGLARSLLMWAARRLPSPRLDTRSAGKLIRTLQQAGYRQASAVRTFQLVRFALCAGITVVALAAAATEDMTGASAIFLIIGGAVAGAFAPNYYLGRRAHKRQAAIARELSDVLDLLVVCVEAGMGLHESIKIVGTEVEAQGQEIGRELALVSAEMSAGRSMGEALRAFADRTAIEDLKPLAATMIQSEQMGAQIAPALRGSSDMLRASRRLRAEEQAQKSTIKILFPLVLFVLPAMLIVIVGPALLQIIHTINPTQ
jgi:tight adherence protein C